MTDSATTPKTGSLGVSLATWLFILHQTGHAAKGGAVADAVDALAKADAGSADSRGQALASLIEEQLGADADFDAVVAWLGALYSADSVITGFGDTRAERLHGARSYQFRSSLPWIARIYDRFPDGRVGAHWVLVERVTDSVTCMDPYPWDDLDEEYDLPVVEFMVKWELAGCGALAFRA